MRYIITIALTLTIALSLSSCISFSKYEVKMRDQKVAGNRGVLKGDVPVPDKDKPVPTREMVRVDIEILDFSDMKMEKPTFDKEKTVDTEVKGNRGYFKGSAPDARPKPAPKVAKKAKWAWPWGKKEKKGSVWPKEVPEGVVEAAEEVAEETEPEIVEIVEPKFDIYVVKKGETLSQISQKPEVYGTSKRWKEIFEANRDQISNPDKIVPGMKLRVPRD